MYYKILEKLKTTTYDDAVTGTEQYVLSLKPEEWGTVQRDIKLEIDMDFNTHTANSTKAEVNTDSLTGTFKIPNRENILGKANDFSFALDHRGIVLIDDHEYVNHQIRKIQKSKKWKYPSMERFIYDFLENIIKGDIDLLEEYDKSLDEIEDSILSGIPMTKEQNIYLNQLRRKLTKLHIHYSQLIELSQEFSENENSFFKDENIRLFHMFSSRVTRLESNVLALRENILQIRSLSQSQLEINQNKNMAILTIVTTCCMPLTILVGWYGMNFKYMPELYSKWGYPSVIAVAIIIFTASILYFKHKKWL